MDELVYKSLVRYFKVLGELGYIRYTDVYRLIVLIHLQELINSSAKYFITENDCRLMQETLYTLTGSTCLISFPYQRCSCSGSYTPVTPSPSFDSFTLDIPASINGSKVYSGNRIATFSISNINYVAADTLSIIDVTNNKTLASGLSIVSPVTADLGTLTFAGGKSYQFKATVKGTDGNTYTSNIYSVVCKAVSTVYYGEINSAAEVTSSVITAGSTVDGGTVKTFNAPWDTKVGQFIAIPSVYSLKTIVNSVITSDVWYDATTSIYTEQDMTINNISYKVYYSIKPMPMGEDGIVTIA